MAKELVKAPESLSVWMSNMKELIARQPKLGMVLHDYVQKHGHEFAHFENKTPTGTWVEGLTSEPFFQSNEDPKVDWDKKSRDVPIFFQYGIGTPPYLFKVIRTLPDEALSLIVVEPNIELLVYVLHMTHVYMAMPRGASLTFVTSPKEEPENIRLVKDNSEGGSLPLDILLKILREEALEGGLTIHGLFTAMLSKASYHEGEEQAFRDDFLEIARNIREWLVVRLSFLGNSSQDTMLGLRQMALMSPWIVYGYQYESILQDFRSRPFVVVSAGPSLQKNYGLLRDIQDKCVIIANDAVLKKLLSNGIRPHIVCALERGIATYELLFKNSVAEYPEECKQILLISQAVCTPKIFGTWPGPKIIIGKSELPLDRWFIVGTIRGGAIPSGSSVAHMCMGVADTMGASSIAFIGQDLAYGDDGTSHVSGVLSEIKMEEQKKAVGARGIYKVPGALGGEVETSEIWLGFLRLFESRIFSLGIDVFDCTEGGALIKGTIVEPFAEYISEHVAALDVMEVSPAEIVLQSGVLAEKKARFDFLEPFFEKARQDLSEAGDIIVEIVKSLDKVSSAAILPQKRVSYASQTGALLDRLNRLNPMFAFIAQSYLYLSTAEIAVTRFLDNVETVERWVGVHREIVEGHIAVVRFISNWLDYTIDALSHYRDRELPMKPIVTDESYDVFENICETLGDGHDQTSLRCEMDALFTLADVALAGWPGESLWQCGMFLLQETRSQEAGVLMREAENSFTDMEMPTEQIYSFLKDYTRVTMTPDLCHMPNYDFARLIIQNAVDLCGEDDEIRDLKKELSDRQRTLFVDLSAMKTPYRKEHLNGWYSARAKAEEAMSRDDALTTMTIIWDAICLYGRHIPKIAASHLDWLARNMEKFFDTDDERCKPVIDAILDSIASRPDVLRDVPAAFTYRFLEELAKHGADIKLPEQLKEDFSIGIQHE